MGDTLGQAGDPFAEGGEVPAEIPDFLAHVAQVGPEPSGQGDDQGGREPRKKGFHVPNSRALVVRHVIIFGYGHGLQRAIIDESQHRTPERLIMAQH